MSTKIFCHHPLKRAEQRRLSAPPETPAPVRIVEEKRDTHEKELAALSRAMNKMIQRTTDKKRRDLIAALARRLVMDVVPVEKFIKHVAKWAADEHIDLETDGIEPLIELESVFVDIMSNLARRCVMCEGAVKVGRSAIIAAKIDVDPFRGEDPLLAMVCGHCRPGQSFETRFAARLVTLVETNQFSNFVARRALTTFDEDFLGIPHDQRSAVTRTEQIRHYREAVAGLDGQETGSDRATGD